MAGGLARQVLAVQAWAPLDPQWECATHIPELAGALRQGDPWDSLSSQTSYIHELQASERYVSQQNENQTKEHSEKW